MELLIIQINFNYFNLNFNINQIIDDLFLCYF